MTGECVSIRGSALLVSGGLVVRLPNLRAGGRLKSLGFQSKLLLMLLTVSVVSVLIAGLIGYISGTNSLRTAEYQRLTQLRESRAREITAFYDGITNAATVLTHSSATNTAVRDFAAAFKELQKAPLPPGAPEAVAGYYATVFGPELTQGTGHDADPALFKPTSNAQTYLQSLYTAPAKGDFAAAARVLSAGDPSQWSAHNARYQPFFADFAQRFGFDDVLLLDTEGNVVYTAYKGVDLGANVLGGSYRTTKLADAYRQVMRATSVDEVIMTDFQDYAPAYGVPTPWVLTPIGDASGIAGVLALQLKPSEINKVMTGDRGWEQDGLGETGETYLAGPDKLMRSVSRELLVNPERFVTDVVADGTPADVAKREVELGDSILQQPVDTSVVRGDDRPQLPGSRDAGRLCAAEDSGAGLGGGSQDRQSRGARSGDGVRPQHRAVDGGDRAGGVPAGVAVQPNPHPPGQEPGRRGAPGQRR
jgi:hypothetical protein